MTEFIVKEMFIGEPIGHRVQFYDLLRKLQTEQDQGIIVSKNNQYFFVVVLISILLKAFSDKSSNDSVQITPRTKRSLTNSLSDDSETSVQKHQSHKTKLPLKIISGKTAIVSIKN